MSNLPPYKRSIYWKNYEISENTFELTPIHKGDMSPYLVHMTSKNSILDILTHSEDFKGCIEAKNPRHNTSQWFDCKVVCFSESPLFTLDFFRYRVFERWQQDVMYGIGFSKNKLFQKGVRPIFYVDENIHQLIKSLNDKLSNNNLLSDISEINENLKLFFNDSKVLKEKIMPLTSLVGNSFPKQGHMWEREWRYPTGSDFIFDYEDIEVICCPREEREAIQSKLGDKGSHIKFHETWSDYDMAKEFFKTRDYSLDQNFTGDDSEDDIHNIVGKIKSEKNKLQAFENYLESFLKSKEKVEEEIRKLDEKQKEIEEYLKEKNYHENHCSDCSRPFGGDVTVYENEPWDKTDKGIDIYICGDCYYDNVVKPTLRD